MVGFQTLAHRTKLVSYGHRFYKVNQSLAIYSAGSVTSLLATTLRISSVVDFGCAYGAWLNAWKRAGVADVCGLDLESVDQKSLLINRDEFIPVDLSQSVDLGRVFGLAQSLEVAEHLPASAADTFIDNLVRHANLIFFSAAPPGQGGINHINEQPYSYWRDRFAARGFNAFDFVRPLIAQDRRIQPWYRYNTFLYVHEDHISELPETLDRCRLDHRKPVPDISPLPYRLRKLLVRSLPFGVRQTLAQWRRRYHAI